MLFFVVLPVDRGLGLFVDHAHAVVEELLSDLRAGDHLPRTVVLLQVLQLLLHALLQQLGHPLAHEPLHLCALHWNRFTRLIDRVHFVKRLGRRPHSLVTETQATSPRLLYAGLLLSQVYLLHFDLLHLVVLVWRLRSDLRLVVGSQLLEGLEDAGLIRSVLVVFEPLSVLLVVVGLPHDFVVLSHVVEVAQQGFVNLHHLPLAIHKGLLNQGGVLVRVVHLDQGFHHFN